MRKMATLKTTLVLFVTTLCRGARDEKWREARQDIITPNPDIAIIIGGKNSDQQQTGVVEVYTGHLPEEYNLCEFNLRTSIPSSYDQDVIYLPRPSIESGIYSCGGKTDIPDFIPGPHCPIHSTEYRDFCAVLKSEGGAPTQLCFNGMYKGGEGAVIAPWDFSDGSKGFLQVGGQRNEKALGENFIYKESTSEMTVITKNLPDRRGHCLVKLDVNFTNRPDQVLYVLVGGVNERGYFGGVMVYYCASGNNCDQDLETSWVWKPASITKPEEHEDWHFVSDHMCTSYRRQMRNDTGDLVDYEGVLVVGGVDPSKSLVNHAYYLQLRSWEDGKEPQFSQSLISSVGLPELAYGKLVNMNNEAYLFGGKTNIAPQDSVYTLRRGENSVFEILETRMNATREFFDIAVLPESYLCRSTPVVTSTQSSIPTQSTTPPGLDRCQAVDSRGVEWIAAYGTVADKPCPPRYSGRSSWKCSRETGQFEGDEPDRSDCLADWVTDIEDMIAGDSRSADIAEEIARILRPPAQGDAGVTGGTIGKVLEIFEILTDRHYHEEVDSGEGEMFTVSMVNSTNSLLLSTTGWREVTVDRDRFTSTSTLLRTMDTVGYLYGMRKTLRSSCDNSTYQFTYEAVDLQVNLVAQGGDEEQCFTFEDGEASICAAAGAFQNSGDRGCDVFVATMLVTKEDDSPTAESAIFPNYSENGGNTVISRRVVGLTVNNGSQPLLHRDAAPVTVSFQNKLYQDESGCRYLPPAADCVFWSSDRLGWSDEGCTTSSLSSDPLVVCTCSHLTNFGIFLDWKGTFPANDPALDGVSNFLLIFSSLAVISTQILLFFQKKDNRSFIRKVAENNRNYSLFLAQVAFIALAGLEQYVSCSACQVFGAIIHFFWLTMFAWTALEGYFFYRALVTVFDTDRTSTVTFYLAGYGIPAAIVISTVTTSFVSGSFLYLRRDDEGVVGACWLEGNAILAMVIPVALVVLFNLFVTMTAVYVAHKAGQRRNLPKPRRIITSLRNTLLLSLLLGLTWIVGFLPSSLGQQYIFVILNSSMGFYILIYSVVANRQVRGDISERVSTMFSGNKISDTNTSRI